MVAYVFLFLFVTAALVLIIRSHYRWTYFFASALFVFLAGGMLMLTAQWQRLEFRFGLVCGADTVPQAENPLLQTAVVDFRLFADCRLAELGNAVPL